MAVEETWPYWSVVVPLYNKQEFIEATLRSVLRQSDCSAFEVLVVDDGSRDEGPARVLAITDPRVHLIRQANSGVSAARNHGIRASRGRWVAFLDADDLLHPSALAEYERLQAEFPTAGVVAGAYIPVPSNEVDSYVFTAHDARPVRRAVQDLPAELCRSGMPFFTSSVAVKRDLLDQLSDWFPVGESMGEDWDLWLRLAEATTVAHSSAETALYRTELAASLVGQYKRLELLPVWQRLRQRAQAGNMPLHMRSSALRLAAEMEVTLARRLILASRRREALSHLVSAHAAAGSHRWWITLLCLCTGWRALLRR